MKRIYSLQLKQIIIKPITDLNAERNVRGYGGIDDAEVIRAEG